MTLALLILSVSIAANPAEFTVETLDGQKIAGALVEFNDQSIAVDTGSGRREIEVSSIARIAQKDAESKQPRPSVWIALTDGSRLTATSLSVDGEHADVRLTSGESLRIPRRQVQHVRLKNQDEEIAREWKKILQTDSDADLLVIRKQGKIDFLEGVVGDISSIHVKFSLDGDVIPVKIEKVEGIVYHRRSGEAPAEAQSTFHVAGGGRVPAVSWKLDDKGRVFAKTPLELSITIPLVAVTRVDLTAGKLAYLSDLEPTATKWTPYIGGGDELPLLEVMFRPRNNKAMDGGPLRLGGRDYAKGLAIHSRTLMTFELRAKYRRFKTLAGIDDRMRDRGHVELVITGDGRELYKVTMQGKDKPVEIDLDISKVRRFHILVDYGKDLDIADHLNLIDARVIK